MGSPCRNTCIISTIPNGGICSRKRKRAENWIRVDVITKRYHTRKSRRLLFFVSCSWSSGKISWTHLSVVCSWEKSFSSLRCKTLYWRGMEDYIAWCLLSSRSKWKFLCSSTTPLVNMGNALRKNLGQSIWIIW